MKILTDFKYDFTLVLDFKTISPLNGICYPEIPSILLKTFKTLKSLSVVIPQPMLISFFNIIFHHSHSQERMTPDMDSTDHLLTNGTNGTHKHHKKEKVSDTLFQAFLAFPFPLLCKYCLQAWIIYYIWNRYCINHSDSSLTILYFYFHIYSGWTIQSAMWGRPQYCGLPPHAGLCSPCHCLHATLTHLCCQGCPGKYQQSLCRYQQHSAEKYNPLSPKLSKM